jgi:SAM-dependent methyltransferase
MADKPMAFDAYQALAEAYAAAVDTKPHNAYYELPAMLSLMPDVAGLKVLDAGCGPGRYSEWLIEHGADVLAVDASPKMIELANRRLKGRVPIKQADLTKPLDFLEDAFFDLVLCPLVLDYIEDLRRLFREFHRVLKVGGFFLFSLSHPFSDCNVDRQTSYFDTEEIGMVWNGFATKVYMPNIRRPMAELINPLLETGFQLDHMLEPLPTLAFKAADPEEYEKLLRKPGFLCVRALKQKREGQGVA